MDLYLDRPALEAVFHLPDNDGSYAQSERAFLSAQGSRRPVILLAFPPKAAGTFLRAAAARASGGDVLRVCYAQGDRDAQPYLPTFLAYYAGAFCAGPMVAHLHMQAFPANTAFLQALGIRPVIMVRSIPDMLASYWDMLEDGGNGLPMGINCTIPADFRTMEKKRRANFMIEMIAPWYAGYYATWSRFAERHADTVCMLRYSELLTEPAAALRKLLEAAGLEYAPQHCSAAIESVWQERHLHRFSEGVPGRGLDYFSLPGLERIDRLLSYYPSIKPLRAELMGL